MIFGQLFGGEAAREEAVGLSGQRVRDHRIGERKIRAGIEHVGMLVGERPGWLKR